MVDSPKYLDEIKKSLVFITESKGGEEQVFRCPYCGDSQKNKRKGRFYLNLKYNNWICFNCGERGHVNTLLTDLNLGHFKVHQESFIKKKIIEKKYYNLDIPKLSDSDFIMYPNKVSYLCNRMKCNKTELKKLPIFFNYRQFINDNQDKLQKDIDKIFNNEYSLKYKDDNYIGFYTKNKILVSFRNIDMNSEFRYDIYKLKSDDTDFIMLTNKKELELRTITDRSLRVVIAEGIFDVMLPYVHNMISNADIYIVSFGSSKLKNAIKYIVKEYCNFLDIVYLVDYDYINFYKKFFYKSIRSYCSRFSIIRNRLNKDTGEFPIEMELFDKYSIMENNYGK